MSASGKTSVVTSIVAAICILIYIAAVAFGAVRVVIHTGERRYLAEGEFNDIAAMAVRLAEEHEFMGAAYRENIRLFLQNSRTPLLGIIITGPAGIEGFEREPGSGIDRSSGTPRLKTGAGYPREPFQQALMINNQRNVNISAVYSVIDYNFFTGVMWNTLLAVLAALAVATVTLIIELIVKKRAGNYKNMKIPKSIQPDENAGHDSAWYEDALPDFAELERDALEDDAGWKSFIADRLDLEIDKCASSGEDLALVVMQVTDEVSGEEYRKIIDEAIASLSMRDLIYEKKDNCICLILPGVDLKAGITKSEVFRNRAAFNIHMGISARSGRLMKGERLMLEAATALEKALEDPLSPIVAFKIDPDKYREFIKKTL